MNENAFFAGFVDELEKCAKERKMPHFTEQDRPKKVKDIYKAMTHRKAGLSELKKRYGTRAKEVAARVAARQGKPGKQRQGPPYKAPI